MRERSDQQYSTMRSSSSTLPASPSPSSTHTGPGSPFIRCYIISLPAPDTLPLSLFTQCLLSRPSESFPSRDYYHRNCSIKGNSNIIYSICFDGWGGMKPVTSVIQVDPLQGQPSFFKSSPPITACSPRPFSLLGQPETSRINFFPSHHL